MAEGEGEGHIPLSVAMIAVGGQRLGISKRLRAYDVIACGVKGANISTETKAQVCMFRWFEVGCGCEVADEVVEWENVFRIRYFQALVMRLPGPKRFSATAQFKSQSHTFPARHPPTTTVPALCCQIRRAA